MNGKDVSWVDKEATHSFMISKPTKEWRFAAM
jgi:hypothetical protein